MPLNSYKKTDLNEKKKNSKITKFFIGLHYGPLRPGRIGIVNRGNPGSRRKTTGAKRGIGKRGRHFKSNCNILTPADTFKQICQSFPYN